MDIIHVLDKQISDLIAAGEVVERPSSVVKELIENSIDAGATGIKVEIEKGGCSLIRVTDNGKGMSPTDAETAFLKHATSKLSQKSDLFSIKTLGFRGEALCAIASVSEVTLRTKLSDSIEGTYIKLDYGKIEEKKPIAYTTGTSITVENLFGNTPARLKFLKSEAAETAAISALISTLALSNPNIAFNYSVNAKEKLFTYGKGNLKDAIFCVEGKDFSDNIIPVSISSPYGTDGKRITVSGFVGKPLYNRPSRSKQLFYINGRMIRSRIMQNALENAYKSYIMSGRYPVCVLNLSIPFDEVDINVHPGKLEAKFGDERAVYDVVLAAVSLALNKDRAVAPEMKFNTGRFGQSTSTVTNEFRANSLNVHDKEDAQNDISDRKRDIGKLLDEFDKRNNELTVKKYDDWTIYPPENNAKKISAEKISISAKNFDDGPVFADIKETEDAPIVFDKYIISVETPEEKKDNKSTAEPIEHPHDIEERKDSDIAPLCEDFAVSYKYIGECFNTYILLEGKEELYIIDKHALHERMNFEKLKKERTHESQLLLTPVVVSLDADRLSSVISRKDFLYELGFDVDEFGDDTVVIRAIPVMLNQSQAEAVICNFADTLTGNKAFADAELLDEFLYDVACKASIRAGAESSEVELRKLADDYMRNRDTLSYCPHGRPVMVTMSKGNIEKNFKRLI